MEDQLGETIAAGLGHAQPFNVGEAADVAKPASHFLGPDHKQFLALAEQLMVEDHNQSLGVA